MMNIYPEKNRSVWHTEWLVILLIIFIIAITVLLITRGYPLPCSDDLAITGAALSLTRGDGFQNPYVREWMAAFPTDKPFFYPPGMSYLLAGWLFIFGIGVKSMLAFQWTALVFGASTLGWFLYRWCAVPISICAVAGLSFILAFQLEGFRNEVPAYALAFLGMSLSFYDHKACKLAGYFLLAFSGVVYPLAPLIAAPVYFSVFLTLRPADPLNAVHLWKSLCREIPYAAIGVVLSGVIFSWMIDGEFSEFFRVLRIHKETAIPGGIVDQLKGFYYINTAYNQILIRLPLTLASLIALTLSIIMSIRSKTRDWIIPTGIALGCLICIIGNPMRAKTFVPIFQIVILMFAIKQCFRGKKLVAVFFGLLFAGLINIKTLVGVVIQSPVNSEITGQIRKKLKDVDYERTRIMICPWSARYIFLYDLPPQIIDIYTWGMIPRFHGMGPTRQLKPSTKPPNEIWVARSEDLHFMTDPSEQSAFPLPKRAVYHGKTVNNIPASQAEFIIKQ